MQSVRDPAPVLWRYLKANIFPPLIFSSVRPNGWQINGKSPFSFCWVASLNKTKFLPINPTSLLAGELRLEPQSVPCSSMGETKYIAEILHNLGLRLQFLSLSFRLKHTRDNKAPSATTCAITFVPACARISRFGRNEELLDCSEPKAVTVCLKVVSC